MCWSVAFDFNCSEVLSEGGAPLGYTKNPKLYETYRKIRLQFYLNRKDGVASAPLHVGDLLTSDDLRHAGLLVRYALTDRSCHKISKTFASRLAARIAAECVDYDIRCANKCGLDVGTTCTTSAVDLGSLEVIKAIRLAAEKAFADAVAEKALAVAAAEKAFTDALTAAGSSIHQIHPMCRTRLDDSPKSVNMQVYDRVQRYLFIISPVRCSFYLKLAHQNGHHHVIDYLTKSWGVMSAMGDHLGIGQ